ncbi:hypothetical protein CDD81_2193 [Ophiocordyceps australis]|uniref:NAD(P)-binding domain-containing protein n=1 Tax=Ophiocordyceps australis TaxID=1399860 RepID=A0A2C5XRX6_9HYPO|nr:hypothetical protein CDD81_2193 [Ophiocordyceps australis]
MKVIVTGATGNLGRFIVQHCLDHADITSVVILTRRAVAGHVESHPKVQVVMHHDFGRYPDALLQSLHGAEACLWAIGHVHQADHDKETLRHITIGLSITAAQNLSHSLADKTPNGAKFRFVFCSTRHASSSRMTLLLVNSLRRFAAEAERGLCQVADMSHGRFEAYMLRPLSLESGQHASSPLPSASAPTRRPAEVLSPLFAGMSRLCKRAMDPSRVAKAMVVVACSGWKHRFINNEALLDEPMFAP